MQLGLPDTGLLDGPLGLLTEGLLGLSGSLDPAFVVDGTPTATGGSLWADRADGVWLLDFDMRGQRYRFASRQVSVSSRDLNADVVFFAGLDDLAPTLDAETLSVSVSASESWSDVRRRIGPITGRGFVLRRWFEDQYLEDAFIVLQGELSGVKFGSPEQATKLSASLRRSERALSLEMISADLVVGQTTWGADDFDNGVDGAGYPIVIGCPGSGVVSGSPAMYVSNLNQYVLVAGHPVAATQVVIYDETGGGNATVSVQEVSDNAGNRVSVCDLTGSGLTIGPGRAYFASFSRSDGGGVLDQGRGVSGLGDLLIWGSKNFSRAVFDIGEMQSRRLEFNRYRIDTVINEIGCQWEDWVQQNLVDLFNLEVVNGLHGLYYRQVRFDAPADQVVATLTADAQDGGVRVSRISEFEETTEEIFNQIAVRYAPSGMSTDNYTASVILGPTRDATTGQIPDSICARSILDYDLRPKTLGTQLTHDRATAHRLARDAVLRYAMPKLVATYEGSNELFRLRKGHVVSVNDHSPGADLATQRARVTGLAFARGNSVRVTLLFPGDLQ